MVNTSLFAVLAASAALVTAWPAARETVGPLKVGTTIRLMPFGASITAGIGSTTKDGWRKSLFDTLVSDGNNVSFVGTRHYGSMKAPNNSCEAWPGLTIGQAWANATKDEAFDTYRPNVVIMTLGTNNCEQKNQQSSAHDEMLDALKGIHSLLPRTVVLVAGLTALVKDPRNCILDVNAQIEDAVKAQSDAGQLAHFVDSYDLLNKSTDYYHDGIHPNDAGYVKLNETWYEALAEYSAEITAPLPLV